MATSRSQRIGIWIIAIVLLTGTLGSFLLMGLSADNSRAEQAAIQKRNEEYVRIMTEYQNKVNDQNKELSNKYYPDLNKFASTVSPFVGSDVKELKTNDLKVGDGAEIVADSEYSAYYIGWNPKGVIFDQSIENGTLKAPLGNGSFIAGWNEGIIGMKLGGIREITMPSDKAYGKTGSGENIPPNTPLKFIVMLVPKAQGIPLPDPDSLPKAD
jgi:FKBP-type peptidyl-prolyl cis-trans isomerase